MTWTPVVEWPRSRSTWDAWAFSTCRTRCGALGEVFTTLQRLAPTDVTITLIGETGTGKDVLAHAIHEESPRANHAFVVFDCGAVAPNLAESELLGHERGAFTGAVQHHSGAFERAHRGTLFLDEVGEMPLDLQPRLLRALEERSVRRVGGADERRVDVRVVAATNRDLWADVLEGRFRRDLYFRLAGAVLPIPPLRERRDDLPLLVESLLADLGHPRLTVSEAALERLMEHPWPGNLRELRNVLTTGAAFADGRVLEPRHLTLLHRDGSNHAQLSHLPLGGCSLVQLEKAAIVQTLAKYGGNKTRAARQLGIATSTLYEKLRRHGI